MPKIFCRREMTSSQTAASANANMDSGVAPVGMSSGIMMLYPRAPSMADMTMLSIRYAPKNSAIQ